MAVIRSSLSLSVGSDHRGMAETVLAPVRLPRLRLRRFAKNPVSMTAFCADDINNRFTKYGVFMACGTLPVATLGQTCRDSVKTIMRTASPAFRRQ
jgi:hypothetical protein